MILETILFLETEAFNDLIQFSIQDISSLPIFKLEQFLSSRFLSLTNENELFEYILQLIKEDPNNLSLIEYIYF
jgi:hypothetical protein